MAIVMVSILALREKGDNKLTQVDNQLGVSILALREKGDSLVRFAFNNVIVSILALREKGDRPGKEQLVPLPGFNPRPS